VILPGKNQQIQLPKKSDSRKQAKTGNEDINNRKVSRRVKKK
jgi:hypothetical protein